MSLGVGVDTLGGLAEKLKQLINDTQDQYESFIDATQLYKKGKMKEKEFFAKIGDYLIATSAMNFLAIRVIFEIKSAMEKRTSMKNPTSGTASSSTPRADFGIGGFVGAGGSYGGTVGAGGGGGEYSMPAPQQEEEPTFKPVDIVVERPDTKNCIVCGSTIPKQAKFCNKCGNAQ